MPNYLKTISKDGKITIFTRCQFCKDPKEVPITVDLEKFKRWQNGEFIQDVFNELTSSERERLMTGTCDECWDEEFSEDEPDYTKKGMISNE